MKKPTKTAGISDEAVRAKTGKGWQEWFKVLDKAGARKMNHTNIATYLYDKQRVPGWWCQMVTVGYEQARGLRVAHQKPTGFEIGRSKTLTTPLGAAYRAWSDEKLRARWLGESGVVIRKATPNKSMRITWADGETSVAVYFTPKGKDKCVVTVQHSKLASATQAERMKAYWAGRLDRLFEQICST